MAASRDDLIGRTVRLETLMRSTWQARKTTINQPTLTNVCDYDEETNFAQFLQLSIWRGSNMQGTMYIQVSDGQETANFAYQDTHR